MQQSFSQLECLFPREFNFGEWLYGGAQGMVAGELPAEAGQLSGGRLRASGASGSNCGRLRADVPFADCVVEYLNALSQALLRDPASRAFPDVVTFAFFCRKANVLKLKDSYNAAELRLGRGLVFHIAPSNVPINFAYSLVAGLLAGNYNVVRVSSKQFPQVDLVVKHIAALGGENEVSRRIAIVRYGHESNANEIFSAACDVRVIWGGDATIAALRQCPIPPRSFDICFADRYSLAAIDADRFVADFQLGTSSDGQGACLPTAEAKSDGPAAERELERLAEKFYNDTYLFDQNACSAPHLVAWTGSSANVAKSKELFWGAVHRYARKHYANFQEVMAVDKLTALYRQAVDMDLRDEPFETNVLRRVELKELPENIDDYRCAGGYFTEFTCGDGGLDEIVPIVKNKYQTLAYYGYDKARLEDFVLRNRLVGIDRIVPLGETTAFSLTWDGYDLVDRMTRIVSIL